MKQPNPAVPSPDVSDASGDLVQRLRRDVEHLSVTIGERHTQKPEALQQTADYLTKSLAELGYAVDTQTFSARGVGVHNLAGERRGKTKPDEIVVIGAHYDSVWNCPAANDNGSGVAAVLEIARVFAKIEPDRTVRFVLFVNEEPPFFQTELMGSLQYAKRCKSRGENVVAMLSLETIGYFSDKPGSQRYPAAVPQGLPDVGNYIALVSDVRSAPLLKEVEEAFNRHSDFPSQSAAAPESVAGVGFSDQWSFWRQGYPAVMVTDTAPFRYPYYHTPQDTPDKMDFPR
ncbi:MAG TPA: M28 family peptidase, partial [Tepidisphaeraceae bacterium]